MSLTSTDELDSLPNSQSSIRDGISSFYHCPSISRKGFTDKPSILHRSLFPAATRPYMLLSILLFVFLHSVGCSVSGVEVMYICISISTFSIFIVISLHIRPSYIPQLFNPLFQIIHFEKIKTFQWTVHNSLSIRSLWVFSVYKFFRAVTWLGWYRLLLSLCENPSYSYDSVSAVWSK